MGSDPGTAYRGAVFVVPEFPWPSTSGGRVRAANLAGALGELGTVTLLAPDAPDERVDSRWAAAGRRYRRRRLTPQLRAFDLAASLVAGRHIVVQRAARAGVPEAFLAILADLKPSVVILGRPFLGPFREAARKTGAVVIAEVDESFDKVSRSVLRANVPFAKRFRAMFDLASARRLEASDLPLVDQVWVSSPVEQATLREWTGTKPIAVVPSGSPSWPDAMPGPPALSALAFVGYYAHPPNEAAAIELVEEVLPAVRAAGGPARLMLIGREPTPRLLAAAASDPLITVTGTVPNPSAVLREAGVLIMPIRSGAGTRIKALDAIASGVPIISTAFGVEGLDLRPGIDFLLAESPTQFASAVAELRDDARRENLARSAFARVAPTQSPAAVVASVRRALAEVGLLPQPA